MNDDEETRDDEKLVQKTASDLYRRFDTVRVTVTKMMDDGGTATYSYGLGNYFAQRDSVREWLMRQDHHSVRGGSDD